LQELPQRLISHCSLIRALARITAFIRGKGGCQGFSFGGGIDGSDLTEFLSWKGGDGAQFRCRSCDSNLSTTMKEVQNEF
jgi:hypothetical protein